MKFSSKALCFILLIPYSLLCPAQDFIRHKTFAPNDGEAFDQFGSFHQMDINDSYLIVGSSIHGLDENGANYKNGAGAVYIYSIANDTIISFLQKVDASDRESDDRFGFSGAIDNANMVIAAMDCALDELQSNYLWRAGAVYIFNRNIAGKWVEHQKLVPSDRDTADSFGWNLDLIDSLLVVSSAYQDFDTSGNLLRDAGAVYLFNQNATGEFEEVQKLVASDRGMDDGFGGSVFLLSPSEILIGASSSLDMNGNNYKGFSGAVYYFKYTTSTGWQQSQKITAFDRDSGDYFGGRITAWGDFLAIGAFGEDYDESGNNYKRNAGAVYVYRRNMTGNWLFHQKLVSPYRTLQMIFGHQVTMHGDILAVGAFEAVMNENNTDSVPSAGATFIYIKDGLGNWNFSQMLLLDNRKPADHFGSGVILYEKNLIVSAPGDELGSIMSTGTCTYFTIPDSGIGISDLSSLERPGFTVYPNPSSGSANLVSLTGNIDETWIYDVTGKIIIHKSNVNSDKTSIVFPESSENGLYFIQVVSGEKTSGKKILLQRQ